MPPVPQHPSGLLPGMLVGAWRILDWRGSGAFGAVYLAEGAESQPPGTVVLKLSMNPREVRFGREAALLSRLSHPCIPRFIDQGQWLSPFGLPHPFIVMEWVHGLPLYMWARAVSPSSRQVLRVLADVARALEVTHSLAAVHRDVKGDNVLVRREDGRGFLTDFGSSTWKGADPLTDGIFPPATPNYRSPEAYRFAANVLESPIKQYSPGKADDLFALGVTGYRLVTGQYPPLPQDPKDPESRVWDELDGPGPRPARELNPGCCAELSALISRMLSVRPEDRGSAREVAEALEQAAREAGPEADAPLYTAPRPVEEEAAPQHFSQKADVPVEAEDVAQHGIASPASLRVEVEAAPEHHIPPPASLPVEAEAVPLRIESPVPRGNWWPWLVAAGLAGTVVLGATWRLSRTSDREEEAEQVPPLAKQEEARDGGTVGLGDSTLTAPVGSIHEPFVGAPIALDLPSKPLPGQARPDARGRCPHKNMVVINGACWTKLADDTQDCSESKGTYVYKGRCYAPFLRPQRPPTSEPTESRDGG